MLPVARCTFLMLLVTVSVPAQTPRQDVADQLKVVTDIKAEERFTPDQQALGRPTLFGVLEHDTVVHLEVTLDAAREYHIAARCDTGCADLDTRVLTPDFGPLAQDTAPDDVPHMDVRPEQSGPHLLAVRMASCKAQICYFGVVVLSRPVQR